MEGCDNTLCAMEPHLQLKRFPPPTGSKPANLAGQSFSNCQSYLESFDPGGAAEML